MRRNKTQSLSEVLNDLINEYRIGPRLREAAVINAWSKITGKAISSRTSKIYMKNGILHIHLTSSVVKSELLMLREALRDQLNKEAGANVVKDIVIH
jgi:predicted nucleic acid-binding Zn ribbon protein